MIFVPPRRANPPSTNFSPILLHWWQYTLKRVNSRQCSSSDQGKLFCNAGFTWFCHLNNNTFTFLGTACSSLELTISQNLDGWALQLEDWTQLRWPPTFQFLLCRLLLGESGLPAWQTNYLFAPQMLASVSFQLLIFHGLRAK